MNWLLANNATRWGALKPRSGYESVSRSPAIFNLLRGSRALSREADIGSREESTLKQRAKALERSNWIGRCSRTRATALAPGPARAAAGAPSVPTHGRSNAIGPVRVTTTRRATPSTRKAPTSRPPGKSRIRSASGTALRDAIDEDAVETAQRPVRLEPVGMAQIDRLAIAIAAEALMCGQRQRAVALQRDDLAAHCSQQRRDIARAGADLEHAGRWLHLERGHECGDRVRRRHRLSARQRHRDVLAREIGKARRRETLARHPLHGAQQRRDRARPAPAATKGRRQCARPRWRPPRQSSLRIPRRLSWLRVWRSRTKSATSIPGAAKSRPGIHRKALCSTMDSGPEAAARLAPE
jgi:hypothetical protein